MIRYGDATENCQLQISVPCHNRMNMNYFKIQIAMTYIAMTHIDMTHIDMTYIDKHAHFYTPVET